MKYLFLWTIFCSAAFAQSAQEARDFLKDFDLSYYHPQTYGLRDFKVDVRLSKLTEKLNRQLVFGKLKDVFFEVSWLKRESLMKPDNKKVEVFGWPGGFFEIKSQLSNNILQRIDFIVPISLSERMKDYELSMTINKDGTRTIISKDPQNLRDANEIILIFDEKKKLKRFVVKRPIGLEEVELKLNKKLWSKGKWVVSEYKVKKTHGLQKIKSKSTFNYRSVGGLGFPETIQTVSRQMLVQPSSGKSGTYEREVTSLMKFSNWRVNNSGLKKSDF